MAAAHMTGKMRKIEIIAPAVVAVLFLELVTAQFMSYWRTIGINWIPSENEYMTARYLCLHDTLRVERGSFEWIIRRDGDELARMRNDLPNGRFMISLLPRLALGGISYEDTLMTSRTIGENTPRFVRQTTVRCSLGIVNGILVCIGVIGMIPYFKRRSRRRRGLCTGCAYDLRKNLSGICPECGTSIDPKKLAPGVKSVSTDLVNEGNAGDE